MGKLYSRGYKQTLWKELFFLVYGLHGREGGRERDREKGNIDNIHEAIAE